MRRSLSLVGILPLLLLAGLTPSQAQPAMKPVLVIALPEAEARLYLDRHLGAVALGVYPPSRDARAFVSELGKTGSDARAGDVAGALAHLGVKTFVSPRVVGQPVAAVASAFTAGPPGTADALAHAPLAVAVLRFADDADALTRFASPFTFVIGVGERTPVLIGAPGAGLWKGAQTGRRGIVTPYDVARAILGAAGVDGGTKVQSDADPVAFVALDALRARLERDVDFGPGLSIATVGFGLGALLLGALGLVTRRPRLASAGARIAALVPVGYLVGLFIPSSAWEVRALALVAAALVGLASFTHHTRRFCGWVLLLTSVALLALTVAAAVDPSGEPALSVWGDPLTSWRFFGLRNHLVAFLASGLIGGLALLRVPAWMLFLIAVGGATVVGAAALGANFVGVLTLVFGATLATFVMAVGRMRAWHVVASAVVGVLALAGALWADAGAQLSHGGRALASITADGGGPRIAWRMLRARAALSYDEVVDLHAIGWISLVGASIVIAFLFVWAHHSYIAPANVRAAVGGVAAAALAALVLEDSGLFTGGIMGMFAAIGFIAWRADTMRATRAGSTIRPGRDLASAPQVPGEAESKDDDPGDPSDDRELPK